MKTYRILTLSMVLIATPINAEDSVYESHTDVMIGRVFLSQAERELLDARRHLTPTASAEVTSKGAVPAAKPSGVGFIKGPNGQSRVWQQGEFVKTAANPDSLPTPNHIKIVRHADGDGHDDED